MRQGPPARQRRSRQRGQGLTEYALTIALVGVMAIVGLGLLKTAVTNAFNGVASSLKTPVVSGAGGGGSGVGAITGQSFTAYTDPNCYVTASGNDGGVWCLSLSGSTYQMERVDPGSRAVVVYTVAPPSSGAWMAMAVSTYDSPQNIYLVGQGTNSGCKFIIGVFTPTTHAYSTYTTTADCTTTSGDTIATANSGGNNFAAAIGADTGGHNLWVTAVNGSGGEAFMWNTSSRPTSVSYYTSGATQFWGYIIAADSSNMMFVNVSNTACNMYTEATGTGATTLRQAMPLTGGACKIGGIALASDNNEYIVAGTTLEKVTDGGTWSLTALNLLFSNNAFPVQGPDGAIWMTNTCAVDQVTVTPSMVETNYVVASSCSSTFYKGYGGLLLGPDSALWDIWGSSVPSSYLGRIA